MHSEPASQVARAQALSAVGEGQRYHAAAQMMGQYAGDTVSQWVACFNLRWPDDVRTAAWRRAAAPLRRRRTRTHYSSAWRRESDQSQCTSVALRGYRPIWDYRRALCTNGTCVVLGSAMAQVVQGLLLGPVLSRFSNKKVGFLGAQTNQKDLVFMRELAEAGKVVPVIDRRYPLSAMLQALRYLVDEHARGKVVITLAHLNPAGDRP